MEHFLCIYITLLVLSLLLITLHFSCLNFFLTRFLLSFSIMFSNGLLQNVLFSVIYYTCYSTTLFSPIKNAGNMYFLDTSGIYDYSEHLEDNHWKSFENKDERIYIITKVACTILFGDSGPPPQTNIYLPEHNNIYDELQL